MPALPRTERAVFLDRDGVLNYDSGYAFKVEDLQILPFVAEGLKALKQRGFALIVVSNQSGVARGKFGEEDVAVFHEEMNRRLSSECGAAIDDFFICPHHVDGTVTKYKKICACRKPSSGLLEKAAAKYGIELEKSFMVGDKASDIDCGQSVGCKSVQIRGQYDLHTAPDFLADNFLQAYQWILKAS